MKFIFKLVNKILIISSIISIFNNTYAVCIPNKYFKMTNIYQGDIGSKKIPITIALKFDENKIIGFYSYKNSIKDILIQGELFENKIIKLEAINEDGKIIETFKGNFVEKDPRNHYSPNSNLECDVITGEWENLNTHKVESFYLSFSHIAGPLSNLYKSAGVKNDEIIHKQVLKLKNAIKIKDLKTIGDMIQYPLKIESHDMEITNASDLIKMYDKIFTTEFNQKILNNFNRNLFAKSSGVMLNKGKIWFNNKGLIKTINP